MAGCTGAITQDMQRIIRLLVLDVEPIVLRGIEAVLRPDSRLKLRCAGSLDEALALLAESPSDAVLFDPAQLAAGIAATSAALRRACPHARLLIFSAAPRPPSSDAADGYLSKHSDPAEVAPLVWRAVAPAGAPECQPLAAALPTVSPAEWSVARLVAEGLTNVQIAARLHVSVNTVKTHLARVMSRFGWRRRSELARDWPRRDAAAVVSRASGENHPNG